MANKSKGRGKVH